MRLKDFNAKVNAEKSKFIETSVNFLGHEINSEGIKPAKDKVEALIKAPRPTNVTEVRAFLGLVNFYRKFVKGITEVVYPLYELERKDQKFVWTKSYEDALNKVKDAIVNSPVITNFDPTKETILTTDASSYGIGAVLSQTDKGQEKVVSFFSRTLNESERKLPQIQREALAIVDSVKRFHKFLFGHRFILITDHQPLKSIFGEKKGLKSVKQTVFRAYRCQVKKSIN